MKFSRFCALLLAITVIVAGISCKTQKTQETLVNQIPPGAWVLKSINGHPIQEKTYPKGAPTIEFKDSTSFSGSTGCNRYMAGYKSSDDKISIKMGAMTKMFCPGDGEQKFLEAIATVNRSEMEKDVLTLYEDDNAVLTFGRGE